MKRHILAIDSDDNAYGYEDPNGTWFTLEDVTAMIDKHREMESESKRQCEMFLKEIYIFRDAMIDILEVCKEDFPAEELLTDIARIAEAALEDSC